MCSFTSRVPYGTQETIPYPIYRSHVPAGHNINVKEHLGSYCYRFAPYIFLLDIYRRCILQLNDSPLSCAVDPEFDEYWPRNMCRRHTRSVKMSPPSPLASRTGRKKPNRTISTDLKSLRDIISMLKNIYKYERQHRYETT